MYPCLINDNILKNSSFINNKKTKKIINELFPLDDKHAKYLQHSLTLGEKIAPTSSYIKVIDYIAESQQEEDEDDYYCFSEPILNTEFSDYSEEYTEEDSMDDSIDELEIDDPDPNSMNAILDKPDPRLCLFAIIHDTLWISYNDWLLTFDTKKNPKNKYDEEEIYYGFILDIFFIISKCLPFPKYTSFLTPENKYCIEKIKLYENNDFINIKYPEEYLIEIKERDRICRKLTEHYKYIIKNPKFLEKRNIAFPFAGAEEKKELFFKKMSNLVIKSFYCIKNYLTNSQGVSYELPNKTRNKIVNMILRILYYNYFKTTSYNIEFLLDL